MIEVSRSMYFPCFFLQKLSGEGGQYFGAHNSLDAHSFWKQKAFQPSVEKFMTFGSSTFFILLDKSLMVGIIQIVVVS